MFHRPTINILWVHIFALLGCTAYLIGNLIFSLTDTTDYSCLEMKADPNLFYRPLSIMHLLLVWLGFETSQFINPAAKDWIKEFWRFYFWLAASEVIKMFLTNPMAESVTEYGFLGIAIIYLCVKLWKLYKTHRKR